VTLLFVPVFLVAVLEAAAFFVVLFGFDVRSVPGNSSSYRTRGRGSLEFGERVLEAKIPGMGDFAFLGVISPESKECPVDKCMRCYKEQQFWPESCSLVYTVWEFRSETSRVASVSVE